ncbi:MAG: serpin family protein [Nocardioidaceae bacterium]
MHRMILATLTSGSLLLASACGSDPSSSSAAAHLESKVSMAPQAGDVSFGDLAGGQRDLGHDLATHLTTDDGNLVFSPASLAIAFAMLREGAGGGTADEIDQVIHLPANRQAAYNALLHDLADPGDGDVLELNDALFLDPSLQVEQAYLETIKKWYDAGVEQTQFPEPALGDINGWVKDKTHGRIPRLIDQLDPSSVFALVNTIYLNAKWQQPFERSETSDSDFSTGGGTNMSVPFMHSTSTLDYAEGQGWQAVRLPYRGGEMSMWVLVPTGAAADPIDLLSSQTLAQAADRFAPRAVGLSLPRWDTETTADLTDLLRSLGMKATFDHGDFTALTSDPSFVVSQVLQQANITVGEKGTEAAAASAIIGETSAIQPPEDLVEVNADHPFAFVVMHDPTGVPLFEGVVADPS